MFLFQHPFSNRYDLDVLVAYGYFAFLIVSDNDRTFLRLESIELNQGGDFTLAGVGKACTSCLHDVCLRIRNFLRGQLGCRVSVSLFS